MAGDIDIRDEGFRDDAPDREVGPGRGSPAEVAPDERAARDPERGRQAEAPRKIPLRGWKDVLARTAAEAKRDQIVLLAAGVAFFGLLALVPALLATVAIYGLVADPADVSRHVTDMLGAAPTEVRELIERQLATVTSETPSSIGIGLAVAVVVALWSASSGMKHLMDALNATYDEVEGRKFLKVRGIALLLTVGAIVFVVASITVLTVVPRMVEGSVLGDATKTAINVARWPGLAIAFAVGLAVLYRYGPSRDKAEWRWVSPGAAVATALWLIGSGLFSVYVANFSSFNETYGSLGSVIIAMLWLVLTALAVLLGAELDAEMERQTRYDTTDGRWAPMGRRDAHAADTVGPTADEVTAAKKQQQAKANR